MTPDDRTDAAMQAWNRVLRLIQHTTRTAEHEMSALGMTPAQYLLLAVIVDDGPQRQTDLSKRLRITPASVSQLVARMESNGHIERTADGRANIVDLTAAGRTLFATIEPSHRAHIAHQFEPLSDNQLGQLVSLLDKL